MKISVNFTGLDIRTETRAEHAVVLAVVEVLRKADLFEGAGKAREQFLESGVINHQVIPSAGTAGAK